MTYKISMPHRHTVRYEDNDVTLEFEVELLDKGILLYKKEPRLISTPFTSQSNLVENWLCSNFSHVEIDETGP